MNQIFSAGVLMHPNVTDLVKRLIYKPVFKSLKLNGVFEQIC